MQPLSRRLERWEDSFRGLIPKDPCQEGWAAVILGPPSRQWGLQGGRGGKRKGRPRGWGGHLRLKDVPVFLQPTPAWILLLQGNILRKEKDNIWDIETSRPASGWVPHCVSKAPSTCPSEEHLFPSGEHWVPVWLVMLEIPPVRSKN